MSRPAPQAAGFVFLGMPLLVSVLLFAPLFTAGNRPIPLLILELLALALLVQTISQPDFLRHLSRTMLLTLAGLLLLPLLHLLPLPDSLWTALPGRAAYAGALAAVDIDNGWRPLSLVPQMTAFSGLALLAPVAVFVATAALPDKKLNTLVLLFIGIAVFEAVIGLAQFGTGAVSIIGAAGGLHGHSAIGTYANRDHLAGLLEMALPLGLALLAANLHADPTVRVRPPKPRQHRPPPLRQRLAGLLPHEFRFNRAAMLAAASIAILLGLVFTRSRSGLALGMLAIFFSTLLFARRIGGRRSGGLVAVITSVGVMLALEIGLLPVLERFTEQNVGDDWRWSIYAGALAGIGEFFPLGSGIGTFPAVYRRFQTEDVPMFVNHAHNDYLEWLFEGGLLAGALIAVFLLLYLLRWRQVWTKDDWSQLRFAQVAAGISLLLLGLHGLLDFNLHIPANAIYFAFLAGVFFHHESPPAARRSSSADTRAAAPVHAPPQSAPSPDTAAIPAQTVEPRSQTAMSPPTAGQPWQPPPAQPPAHNPFMD